MRKKQVFQGADGLQNAVIGIGTPRDKNVYSHYSEPSLLDRAQLDNMYRTSWLAKRVVDTVADDMTRAWRAFSVDAVGAASLLHEQEERVGVRRVINDAIRWGRLYGGALVYVGIRDCNPEEPLDVHSIEQGDLEYLYVIDRCRVDTSEQPAYCGPHSLFFGLPEYYRIADLDILVHCSRMLRFGGESLPHALRQRQGMWEDSVLEHIFTSIVRYDTACATLSTMVTEANVDVVQIQNLGDILLQQGGADIVSARLEELARRKSVNRMLVLDAGESYEKRGNNFQNLDDVLRTFMSDVCGAADIPFTRLFGQSAAGFHATGDNDIRQYYDMISAKQERYVRPNLAYFDEVFVRSTLGYMPRGISFSFNPLWQMSHLEKAKVEDMG